MKPTPLDSSSFRWIESQSTESDRQALLSIREALCALVPSYRYLEVGSHLGGSIQPHVIDPRCSDIYSIDPRPLEQPDERGPVKFRYEGNSTDRMLALLSAIPLADVSKIQTFESSSWELAPGGIPSLIDFAFIDGEHTHSAVLKDFVSVRRFLAPAAILAFHDCFITPSAFVNISHTLRSEGHTIGFLHFPKSNVLAISFGSSRLKEALLPYGWRQGLPNFGLQALHNNLGKHSARMVSILRRLKRRYLPK